MRTRKTWIRNWIFKRAVLGFAIAALVVPAVAQARVDEGSSSQSTAVAKLVGPMQQPALPCAPNCVPDEGQLTVSVTKHVGPMQQAVLPCAPNCALEESRLTANDTGVTPAGSAPQVVASPGFDWGDAAIGAGIAFGLVLLAGAAFETTRRLHKPQTA
jgi:hypothetical protein